MQTKGNVSVKAHSTFTLMGRALPLTRRLKKSSDFVKRAPHYLQADLNSLHKLKLRENKLTKNTTNDV